MFVFFHGMRMKLTKKLLPPEVVQEAPGEVVGVQFNEYEAFGRHRPVSQPPPDHECWERGWVLLDYLPSYIEFRLDGSGEDYTGLGKPGVWHREPVPDDWTLQ